MKLVDDVNQCIEDALNDNGYGEYKTLSAAIHNLADTKKDNVFNIVTTLIALGILSSFILSGVIWGLVITIALMSGYMVYLKKVISSLESISENINNITVEIPPELNDEFNKVLSIFPSYQEKKTYTLSELNDISYTFNEINSIFEK